MAVSVGTRVLVDGAASGLVLRLAAPISFWGGVDPDRGIITQPSHPDHGAVVSGTVLVLPGMIGSSSSSAIMLELLNNGVAPCALVMGEVDAILGLGVVAGAEIDLATIPVLHGPIDDFQTGQHAEILPGGRIRLGDQGRSGQDLAAT